MGVSIRAIRPKEYVCDFNTELTEEQEWDDAVRCIYTLDFSPIKHLTQFKEGWWKCDCGMSAAYLDMPYSTYNSFRKAVCAPIHGDWEEYTEKMECGLEPCYGAFAEFLYFADNEGCFDYVIAEKLLKDFTDYSDKIVPTLNKFQTYYYETYTQILKECVRCKGVVFYS